MLSQGVLSKKNQQEIMDLMPSEMGKVKKYLDTFHKSDEYRKLSTAEIQALNDEDIICFALIRKPLDTKKIDIARLGEAIVNSFNRVQGEMKSIQDLNDFYWKFNRLGQENHALKQAVFIFMMMNHSQPIIQLNQLSIKLACLRECASPSGNQKFHGYINLSGLDLKNCKLEFIDFNDADLTDTDLSGALLDQCRFDRALLRHAHVSETTCFRGVTTLLKTEFDPNTLNVAKMSLMTFLAANEDFITQLDFLFSQGLRSDKHKTILTFIVQNIKTIFYSADNFTRGKIISTAMQHPLFGGDQLSHKLTNEFNSVLSSFYFGMLPVVGLTQAQKELWKLKASHNCHRLDFLNADRKELTSEKKENIEKLLSNFTFKSGWGG